MTQENRRLMKYLIPTNPMLCFVNTKTQLGSEMIANVSEENNYGCVFPNNWMSYTREKGDRHTIDGWPKLNWWIGRTCFRALDCAVLSACVRRSTWKNAHSPFKLVSAVLPSPPHLKCKVMFKKWGNSERKGCIIIQFQFVCFSFSFLFSEYSKGIK